MKPDFQMKWTQKKGKLRKWSKKCGSYTHRKEIPSVTLVATITFRKPRTFSSFIQPCKTCRLLECHQKIVLFARVIFRTKLVRFSCLFVCLFVCLCAWLLFAFSVNLKVYIYHMAWLILVPNFNAPAKVAYLFFQPLLVWRPCLVQVLKKLSHRVLLSCFNHQSR